MKRNKITIIGAGNVGATCAHWAAAKELGDIVLYDIVEGVPQGKALDLMQSAPIEGFDCLITGTNDYADTEDSDIVIITAGSPRKPGMSRADLININAEIVSKCTKEVVKYSPNAFLIIVSNPVDAISYIAYKASGFKPNRVFGLAGILDSARFRTFIARELNVSFEDVTTFVLGSHGDDMVPMVRYTYVGGIPVEKLIHRERLEEIVERTRNGGAEIVNHLKFGGAYYAPSAAIIQMVEAILKDKKRILPVTAYLQGEYGYEDVYTGVPAIIGGNGVEKIINLDLDEKEREAFNHSISSINSLIEGFRS